MADPAPTPAAGRAPLRCGSRSFELGRRTYVMGIVNITPDSFSDGGRFLDATAAYDRAMRLLDDGADVVDLGLAGAGAVMLGKGLKAKKKATPEQTNEQRSQPPAPGSAAPDKKAEAVPAPAPVECMVVSVWPRFESDRSTSPHLPS